MHTPGPWTVIDPSPVNGESPRRIVGPLGDIIASTHYVGRTADDNARLIAAAPELLEALRLATIHLAQECPDRYNGGRTLDALSAARGAIAKATGG